jgi:hypothetical protein
MKSVQFACASALCFFSLASSAIDTAQKNTVPDDVRSFVGPSDTLLAYKKLDLFGDGNGNAGAVIILRHRKSAATVSDENPCDLLIVGGRAGEFSLLEKSSKVVDCTYNEDAQNSSDLSENLELKPRQLTYTNQHMGGYDAYCFKYSKEKKVWYLSQATSTFSERNEDTGSKDSFEEKAAYPGDIQWTPLSQFDPGSLSKELKKHKNPLP